MSEAEWRDSDEISLFELGATLLRSRRRILAWTAVGAVVAALTVLSKPAVFVASASFIPQGAGAMRSAFASIAEQFGATLPTANQSQSTGFYEQLLTSRVLLEHITTDTLTVHELGDRQIAFLDLFQIGGATTEQRRERGVSLLSRIVNASSAKSTGAVELSVTTQWRSVSLAIANALITGVNQYNQQTRQSQAAAERKFVEARLVVAMADLRRAEDLMGGFLSTNRQIGNSSELNFQRERLQRDLTLRQQVFTSLTQAYEDVRIREVRDTPVITVFEPPAVPTQPAPRGRLKRVTLGAMLGAFVGILLTIASGLINRGRTQGDPNVKDFVGTLGEVKADFLRPVRWVRSLARR